VLNWLIYHFAYLNLLHERDIPIHGPYVITANVAAYIISFSISFPLGFILSRHIVFPESNLHGRVQFFRYAVATATLILITYLLIKVFAIALPMIRADISYIFIMVITAILSYISQRFFTFTTKAGEVEEEVLAD